MRASDATMAQVWWTRARRLAQDPGQTLTASLQELALLEFAIANRSASIRAQVDPAWTAQPELAERAQRAIAAAR